MLILLRLGYSFWSPRVCLCCFFWPIKFYLPSTQLCRDVSMLVDSQIYAITITFIKNNYFECVICMLQSTNFFVFCFREIFRFYLYFCCCLSFNFLLLVRFEFQFRWIDGFACMAPCHITLIWKPFCCEYSYIDITNGYICRYFGWVPKEC